MKGLIFIDKNNFKRVEIKFSDNQEALHILINDFIEYMVQLNKSEEQEVNG